MKSLYESIISNSGIGENAIITKWVKETYSKYAEIPLYDIEKIKNMKCVLFKTDEKFYVNTIPIKDNIPSIIKGVYNLNEDGKISPCAFAMMHNCAAKNIDLSHLDQSYNAKDYFKYNAYVVFSQINDEFTVSGLPYINEYAACNIVNCPNIILKGLNNPTVEVIFSNISTDMDDITNCNLLAVSFSHNQLARKSTLMHTVYGKTSKVLYKRYGKYYVFVDGIQDALNKFMENNKVNLIYYYTENNERGDLSRCRIKLEKIKDVWAFKK